MITAQQAASLKKSSDNYITEALNRIEAQIKKDAERYHSTKYKLEEFNERFYYKTLINVLQEHGYEAVADICGADKWLLIRWNNFTVTPDGNA